MLLVGQKVLLKMSLWALLEIVVSLPYFLFDILQTKLSIYLSLLRAVFVLVYKDVPDISCSDN